MSKLATPIRRNDNVVIITGKDRGKRGRVLKVVPSTNRLVVEGVNFIKRHTKPNPQLVCPECGKPTRLGRKILADGRKVRICRKCEGVVDK
jgi:large subunit ribosomal protein L24